MIERLQKLAIPARQELIGNALLILGDCRDVMPRLPKIGAVVTDPPYGVLDEAWDDMTRRELARFTMSWVGIAASLSETALISFGQRTRAVIQPILWAAYEDVRQIIWNKGGGHIAEDRLFYSYESIYYCHAEAAFEVAEPKCLEVGAIIARHRASIGLSRGGVDMAVRGKKTGICYRWEEGSCLPTEEQVAILTPLLRLGDDFRAALADAVAAKDLVVAKLNDHTKANAARACDVFTMSPPNERFHPTQKPVALMERCLGIVPDSGIILDPFMGSGTTGVATVQTGGTFIGIEQDERYFDIACKRIEDAQRQGDLFVSAAA